MSPIMSAMVTSGVASFSTYRSSRVSQAIRVRSPSSRKISRQALQMGAKGLSRISQPAMYGMCSSSSLTSRRMIRVLACPRKPRRIKLCRERMAFTICGTTVSSKPTMPGNSGSRRSSLQIRFSRSSSFTLRDRYRSCARSAPKVTGRDDCEAVILGIVAICYPLPE